MFRTTHIRSKLAVAIAIPLVAVVAVAGFEVVSASQDVADIRSQTSLATSSIGPGSLVVRLQDERNRASIDLVGLGAAAGLPVATNEEARGLVDEAVTGLQRTLDGQSDQVQASFAPAFDGLAEIVGLRADIDAYAGPMDLSNDVFADQVFGRYTGLVEAFFDATSTIALSVDDAELRNGVEIIDNATRQSEMRARIVRRVVLSTVTNTATTAAALQDVAALDDRAAGFDDHLRTHAVGPYEGLAEQTFIEPGAQQFEAQVDMFLRGEPVDITSLLAAVNSSDPTTGYLGLRDRISTAMTAAANGLETRALDRQRTFASIAIGALVLALFVTWVASRSITGPLQSLKTQAEEMAGNTLPAAVRRILDTPAGEDVVIPEMAPIAVKSRDEVSEVASALSAVQTSALDLAVEQAVLRRNISDSYINLGRRNQNLLSRQLDFITDLERNESDPDALEGLFRLDHLATRMRRNAESLLVLAGIEPPRQWSAPVKVSDVVRAALGEVEDYQRVVVRHLEPGSVNGPVATDVAHVLAELLENALSFSPPDQTVEIKGRLLPSGYTLAISDNGFGMASEDLMRANRRLAGEESFTVAPSRYLGHYVAGHLATRLGVRVELQDSPAGGVIAKVDLPMCVLANDETDPYLVKLTTDGQAPAPTPVKEPLPAAPWGATGATGPSVTESGLPRRNAHVHQADALSASSEVTATTFGTTPEAPAPTIEAAPVETTVSPAAWDATTPELTPMSLGSGVDQPGPAAEERQTDGDPEPDREVGEQAPPQPPAIRGFGGLAVAQPVGPSLYSIAAANGRAASGVDGPAATPATTTTGLARRVPGAQRPDGPIGGGLPPRNVAPASEEPRTTPEDVYTFLSNFQSGVARGRADSHADTDSLTEDER